mmetsp:Transcript_11588/g.18676  ORF Transcript_11588/g.18676 Transcript_11588/m.18676 type:complete len:363 (-) Transcript_11588:542-1630(-)
MPSPLFLSLLPFFSFPLFLPPFLFQCCLPLSLYLFHLPSPLFLFLFLCSLIFVKLHLLQHVLLVLLAMHARKHSSLLVHCFQPQDVQFHGNGSRRIVIADNQPFTHIHRRHLHRVILLEVDARSVIIHRLLSIRRKTQCIRCLQCITIDLSNHPRWFINVHLFQRRNDKDAILLVARYRAPIIHEIRRKHTLRFVLDIRQFALLAFYLVHSIQIIVHVVCIRHVKLKQQVALIQLIIVIVIIMIISISSVILVEFISRLIRVLVDWTQNRFHRIALHLQVHRTESVVFIVFLHRISEATHFEFIEVVKIVVVRQPFIEEDGICNAQILRDILHRNTLANGQFTAILDTLLEKRYLVGIIASG